jgi:hypothetical protein
MHFLRRAVMQLRRPRHFHVHLHLLQLGDLAMFLTYPFFPASLWQLRQTLLPISPEYQVPHHGDITKRSTIRCDELSGHALI